MKPIGTAAILALTLFVAGCGDREVYLPGERFALREPAVAPPLDATEVDRARPISLPAAVNITEWTHRAGSPTHRLPHAALSSTPQPIWAVDIGNGDGRRTRITAEPVAANGSIFVMDSESTVSAVSAGGTVLWSRSLVPPGERSRDASGGGLAVQDGVLYVTTGFGALHALNATSGATVWVQELDASATGAPTVDGELIYVVARDSRAWAVERGDGRVRWTLPGTPTASNFVGGPGPAVTDRLALFPFGSGEVVATLKRGGVRVWAVAVSGARDGRAYTSVDDITADPVVVGDRVYTGTPTGRLVALDLTSGERIWTADDGAMGPVVVVGGAIFAVNDQAELVRLDAETGARVWAEPLPYFEARRIARRKAIVAHYGPVLAGGRLWVASGDGAVRGFDPETGRAVVTLPIRGGAATRPIVVGGTLFVVSTAGTLHAFR